MHEVIHIFRYLAKTFFENFSHFWENSASDSETYGSNKTFSPFNEQNMSSLAFAYWRCSSEIIFLILIKKIELDNLIRILFDERKGGRVSGLRLKSKWRHHRWRRQRQLLLLPLLPYYICINSHDSISMLIDLLESEKYLREVPVREFGYAYAYRCSSCLSCFLFSLMS